MQKSLMSRLLYINIVHFLVEVLIQFKKKRKCQSKERIVDYRSVTNKMTILIKLDI